MIYLDTSVVLAELWGEPRRPPPHMWAEPLIASRLLEYEVVVRINATNQQRKSLAKARELLDAVRYMEMAPEILHRALERFPVELRTLDALHLATFQFLLSEELDISLATYDNRMLAAAAAMGLPLFAC